ncbi:MAG TPA: FIST N-terminal domain-containing protein [Mycobacteriales bacterium]|nr:FIST N-terminal domain-containing protein [Mycobacteriales bacterium]
MSERVLTDQVVRSAHASGAEPAGVGRELVAGLSGVDAGAVLFFCSPAVDGEQVARELVDAFPQAPVIGCTTAGEFTERAGSTGGASAVVLPTGVVRRAAASLADLRHGIDDAVIGSLRHIEERLEIRLRDVDPRRYVGFVLIDGLHGTEERVNEVLGNMAPLMSFVGGSAGDDLKFSRTDVYSGRATSAHGAALLVVDAAVPFTIVKSCSFEPAGRRFTITDADTAQRIVWELDGRPAAQVYAEAVGSGIQGLADREFSAHPLGLMIDGKPWIRSPQQVIEGRGIKFYCQILPGMEVELMNSTDLIGDTRAAIRSAVDEVGGEASGAVMFNCILRRLEMDAKDLHQPFVDAIGGIPTAGFHTYGESWLGHINQTLTAVVFGR